MAKTYSFNYVIYMCLFKGIAIGHHCIKRLFAPSPTVGKISVKCAICPSFVKTCEKLLVTKTTPRDVMPFLMLCNLLNFLQ